MEYPKPKPEKKRKKHYPSIIQDKKERTCYLCMLMDDDYRQKPVLHEHHIFGGRHRPDSERYGLKVYLCPEHHITGRYAVHNSLHPEARNLMHRIGQREFEKTHTREEFRKIFEHDYLTEDENAE